MIRQWFILGVLFLLTALLFWDFVNKSLLYSPLTEIESIERAADGKAISEAAFKAAWGKEILEKNLFSPQRNAASVPKDTVPKETIEQPVLERKLIEAPIPILSLSGIIENQFGELIAYIQKDKDEAVPLREGDRLGEFKVVEITDRSVQLLFRGEEIILTLSQIETLTR
jgi:hypothetical protein